MLYKPEQEAKITNTRNTDMNNKAQSSLAQIDNAWGLGTTQKSATSGEFKHQ